MIFYVIKNGKILQKKEPFKKGAKIKFGSVSDRPQEYSNQAGAERKLKELKQAGHRSLVIGVEKNRSKKKHLKSKRLVTKRASKKQIKGGLNKFRVGYTEPYGGRSTQYVQAGSPEQAKHQALEQYGLNEGEVGTLRATRILSDIYIVRLQLTSGAGIYKEVEANSPKDAYTKVLRAFQITAQDVESGRVEVRF